MQDHPFWLFDVFTASTPSLPVFNPLWGFSGCTAPEFSADLVSIREGNRQYPRRSYRNGSLGTITLSRGARFFDNDFYRWMVTAAQGNPSYFADVTLGVDIGGASPRRNLVLVHFLTHLPVPAGIEQAARQAGQSILDAAGPVVTTLEGAASFLQPFAPAFETLMLPGRVWLLTGCLPSRYKVGSDFDAASGEVSIQELSLDPEDIEQISLVDAPIPVPRTV